MNSMLIDLSLCLPRMIQLFDFLNQSHHNSTTTRVNYRGMLRRVAFLVNSVTGKWTVQSLLQAWWQCVFIAFLNIISAEKYKLSSALQSLDFLSFFHLFSWLDVFLWDPTLTTSRIFVHGFLLSGKFARSPPSPRAGTKTTELERAEKTERNFSICYIDLLGWLFKLPFLSMQLFVTLSRGTICPSRFYEIKFAGNAFFDHC